MKTVRTSAALWFAAVVIALAALFDAGTASAQCPTVTLINNTTTTIRLCLVDASGATRCFSIPASSITPGAPVMNPVAVISNGGISYPLSPCTPCIRIAAPTTVCATVCYNSVTCTVTVNPCPSPCAP